MSHKTFHPHELTLKHWLKEFAIPTELHKLICNYLKIDFFFKIPHAVYGQNCELDKHRLYIHD